MNTRHNNSTEDAETMERVKRVYQKLKEMDEGTYYERELSSTIHLFLETKSDDLNLAERLEIAEKEINGFYEYEFIVEPVLTQDDTYETWRKRGFTDRESIIYAKLAEMSGGDKQERDEAFSLRGLLSNDAVEIKMEERLDIIEDRIRAFYKARGQEIDPLE